MRYATLAILASILLPASLAQAGHRDRWSFSLGLGLNFSDVHYRSYDCYRPVYCAPPPRVYYYEPVYCAPPAPVYVPAYRPAYYYPAPAPAYYYQPTYYTPAPSSTYIYTETRYYGR